MELKNLRRHARRVVAEPAPATDDDDDDDDIDEGDDMEDSMTSFDRGVRKRKLDDRDEEGSEYEPSSLEEDEEEDGEEEEEEEDDSARDNPAETTTTPTNGDDGEGGFYIVSRWGRVLHRAGCPCKPCFSRRRQQPNFKGLKHHKPMATKARAPPLTRQQQHQDTDESDKDSMASLRGVPRRSGGRRTQAGRGRVLRSRSASRPCEATKPPPRRSARLPGPSAGRLRCVPAGLAALTL